MKKLIALVLALALVLAVAAASAATIIVESGSTAADGSASQDVLNEEVYNAYKLLDYTQSTTNTDAFSYYLSPSAYDKDNANGLGKLLESVGFAFTLSSDGSRYFVNNGDTLTGATVANALYAIKDKIAAVALDSASATATANKQAVFTNLDTGYWFVTSSLGALTSLQTYDAESVIVEKNSKPTVDKTEGTTEGVYSDGPIDANVGDTVYYKLEVTDGVGTNAAITLTDEMTTGLTYKAGSIKIDNVAVADDADINDYYKVTISGQKITIVFDEKFVANKGTGAKITVTYQATINSSAVVDSADGNENKVTLEYSHQTHEDKVYVRTYDFLVKKTDGTNFLDGAEFKLYDSLTGGKQIKLTKDNTGYYVDPNGSADTTIDINSADGCNVRGLAPGDYYLEEVVVPDGYNKLQAREKVTITAGATAVVEITVVNTAGTILPSTGGIGTTIFYILGGLLVVGAAVILVARRKAHD